jgi:hypothetical protein
MIWIFKPVNNNYWFEVREIIIIDWVVKNIKALKISDYNWVLYELEVYKPLKYCKNRKEYNKQFIN